MALHGFELAEKEGKNGLAFRLSLSSASPSRPLRRVRGSFVTWAVWALS